MNQNLKVRYLREKIIRLANAFTQNIECISWCFHRDGCIRGCHSQEKLQACWNVWPHWPKKAFIIIIVKWFKNLFWHAVHVCKTVQCFKVLVLEFSLVERESKETLYEVGALVHQTKQKQRSVFSGIIQNLWNKITAGYSICFVMIQLKAEYCLRRMIG